MSSHKVVKVMRNIMKYLRIIRSAGCFVLVLMLAFINQACTTSFETRGLRARIQNHIKEKVAQVDTIGSVKVGYVTSDEMQEHRYLREQSTPAKRSNLGAFKFTRIGDKDKDSMVFTLYKLKGNFMAERKLSDTGNKKYFFAFGVNKDSKMPAVNVRVEF